MPLTVKYFDVSELNGMMHEGATVVLVGMNWPKEAPLQDIQLIIC